LKLAVYLSALAVGGLERQRSDDVAQGRPREVHDLVSIVEDVVLGALDALFVALGLEVNLGVHPRVQLVAGYDLLRLRVHHDLGDVHQEHSLDERHDPVEPGPRETAILAESLYQSPARRPHHPDARQENKRDHGGDSVEPVRRLHDRLYGPRWRPGT